MADLPPGHPNRLQHAIITDIPRHRQILDIVNEQVCTQARHKDKPGNPAEYLNRKRAVHREKNPLLFA